MSAASKRCEIANLKPDLTNFDVYGLVIGKFEKKISFNKKDPDTPLYVFDFTLRDSPIDFINVTCWGTRDYITELEDTIQIAKTSVRIRSPLVKVKQVGDDSADENYHPWTPSPYQLVVNESSTKMEISDESEEFDGIRVLPIREHNDYFKLEDLFASKERVLNSNVNLLFAIREIGQVQPLIGKAGNNLMKLDLMIFDNTKESLRLTIWDQQLINLALAWRLMSQVVFAFDVKIKMNSYNKELEATATKKTIFIMNPRTKDGFNLYKYAKEAILQPILPVIDQWKKSAKKRTIQELKSNLSQGILEEFVFINGVISVFNIDENFSKCIKFMCKKCNLAVDKVTKKCPNRNCQDMTAGYTKMFEAYLTISDYTSSLSKVKMNGKTFEKIFDVKLDDCLNYDQDQLIQLKWRVLLERFLILIKVSSTSTERDENEFVQYYFKLVDLDSPNEDLA